jgi:hypothetical protein
MLNLNLHEAIQRLHKHLNEYHTQSDLEERDVVICRDVRSAFTYFVDANAWHQKDESGEIRKAGIKLEKLFKRAHDLLKLSDYSNAYEYLRSVDDKLEIVQGMLSGMSYIDISEAQDRRPKTFKEKIRRPSRDGKPPPFSLN